jgi:hypothetical protein
MSDSPPPRPLCKRIKRINSNDTMTWITMIAHVTTALRSF